MGSLQREETLRILKDANGWLSTSTYRLVYVYMCPAVYLVTVVPGDWSGLFRLPVFFNEEKKCGLQRLRHFLRSYFAH